MNRSAYALLAFALTGCYDDIYLGQDGGLDGGSDASAGLDGASSDQAAVTPLPDLRWKWVGAFPAYVPACKNGVGAALDNCPSLPSPPSVIAFGPVQLADNDSGRASVDLGVPAWTVQAFGLDGAVQAATSSAEGADTATASGDLSIAISSGQIITSFDRNDTGAVGFTVTGSTDTSAYSLHSAWKGARGELDSFVLDEASQGRIVTALGPDAAITTVADTIDAYSFTRAGDSTSSYDTQVSDATYAQLGETFDALAQGGYTVTAFGRIDQGDYVLVGTRIPGQTTPRPTMVSTVVAGTEDPTAAFAAGYVMVGWAIDDAGYGTTTTLYQK